MRFLQHVSNHEYDFTIIDAFLSGIGVISLIICVLSLWLPINEKVLYFILTLSVFSIGINRNKWYHMIKVSMEKTSFFQSSLFCIVILAFLMIPVWFDFVNHDPLFYHYSNIKWNETYSVVPGLANLEERFGFNSNYFLFCSLFSLRSIFGDLIIGIQSLLAVLVMCWILREVIKTDFEIKRVVLCVLYLLFIFINRIDLGTSSTDIIPSLVIIYLFSNLILYPDRVKYPTYILIPIILITFKLSSILLLSLSLYPLLLFFKNKQYKLLSVLFLFSVTIMVTWMIRNVIISGYLLFPYWQIDWFNFDWQLPIYIPQSEQSFITEYARDKFVKILDYKHWGLSSTFLFPISLSYLLSFISSIIGIVLLIIKRNKVPSTYLYIFTCLLIGYIFWFLSAPDIRFGYGFVFSIIYFALVLLLAIGKCKNVLFKGNKWKYNNIYMKNALMMISAILFLYSSFSWMSCYRYFLSDNYHYSKTNAHLATLYKPLSTSQEKDRVIRLENFSGNLYTPHKLNEYVTIYVANMKKGFFFDIIPIMRNADITKSGFIQDYRNIEARGSLLKDGFRSKELDKTKQ